MDGIIFLVWLVIFIVLVSLAVTTLSKSSDERIRSYDNMILWIALIVKLILLIIVTIATLTSNIPAFTVLLLVLIIFLM